MKPLFHYVSLARRRSVSVALLSTTRAIFFKFSARGESGMLLAKTARRTASVWISSTRSCIPAIIGVIFLEGTGLCPQDDTVGDGSSLR